MADNTKEESEKAAQPATDSIVPVAFSELFRFATPFELGLNVIGFITAVGAGSAQVLMSFLFGNLTQSFVTFSASQTAYLQNVSNATALREMESAAANFRSAATTDASYLVYMGIAMLVASYTYMVIWVYTGEQNAKRVREKYFQAILRQEIAYFDTVGAGEIATRIQNDTHLVQQGVSQKVALSAYYISSFCTGFILAFARSWRVALVMFSVFPCIAIATGILIKFVAGYMMLSLKHVAESGSVAEETISTVRTAHAFGIQKILGGLYDTHIQAASAIDAKAAVIQGAMTAVFFFVIYASYALAFWFGTIMINEGHATAGQVVNVVQAILLGSFSLTSVAPELLVITRARGAAAKLFATIDRIPDIDSSDASGLKPEKVVGEITLEGIKFSYPSRPDVPIVKGIDITFAAGQTAALVGASGSGKSTIVSLIERFYDPLAGSVKLDGVDLRDLNVKWLRSQIGFVSQEPTLFATSIRGNIEYGLVNTPYEHLPEEEKLKMVKEACIKANADGFISKLPDGYDTMVGERGFLLSGGQKQRVAIARAIVSDPRILLLDEATSALDTQSEEIVQDALDKAATGRTTITIAHRLSTIKDADCIYVMGGGMVLEKGTHTELLADDNSVYTRLVHAQKLREKELNDTNSAEAGSGNIDTDKIAELPLTRKETVQSNSSSLTRQSNEKKLREVDEENYSIFYILMRVGQIHRGSLWKYTVAIVMAMITGMVYPVFGILYGRVVSGFSQVNSSIRQSDGNKNALGFLVVAIVSGIATGVQNYILISSAAIITSSLRSLSYRAILRQDIEYFDRDEHSTGALTASLNLNPQKINSLAGVTLGAILQGVVTAVGGSIIGFVYSWKVALVGTACTPLLLSAGYIRTRVVLLKDVQTKKAHERATQIACEAAAAIRTVASLTREEDCLRIYSERLEEPLKDSKRVVNWDNLLFAFTQSSSFYVVALIFWYGATLVARLELSIMSFFTALMCTTFGAIQASNTFSFAPDITAASAAGTTIMKLLDSVPEIDAESPSGKTFDEEKVQGRILFENVCFRYPTRPGVRVLRDLSLKIEPGTYVALVGASGCGKSTVIQLIERFYDPITGRILLDDRPINELNITEYRKQIALVSQEPTLYSGTIRFNVLLGAMKPESEVTQDEIEAACRDANILEFIQSLPHGFDTQVGGKGSQLSGGQKQRIAIARALLRNPKVLLLDEATSALDSNSEKVVQDALDNAAKGRTTIAIAHRLSTIQNADCIYFVKDGRVSEAGTHDELLSLRGDYCGYVQLQGLTT